MLDIILIAICLIALVNTNTTMAKRYGLPNKHEQQLHYLLFYHLFFSLFFTYYILNFGGDSQGYWRLGMQQVVVRDPSWMKYFGTSTTFILWLCYIPSKILGLSYITGNILFGFLGFMGIRYIFVMTAQLFPMNHKVLNIPLFPLIFYFPNLHFWSAGVGKDAVCFWGIAWFLFAVQNYKSKWWQGAIALFFVYMARPHMGQALVAGAGFGILLGSEIRIQYKVVLGTIATAATFYLTASTMEFLELDELTLESLEALSETTVGNLSRGKVGSAVDTGSYSLPMKLFTYMFRPLFFDAHNFMAILSSFENALYLWLSFFIYRNWTPEALRDMPAFLKTGIIVFVPVTFAFMTSLSNLGVILRMKNMTMIYFLLFCFFLIAYNKKLRYQRAQEKIDFYVKRQEVIERKKAGLGT